MDLKPWNPWKELERLQSEMDQDFRSFLDKLRLTQPGVPIGFVPPIDVVETADEYQFFAALPGMEEEDIDIMLQDRLLVIRGEREPLYDPAGVTVHQSQCKYGFFERRIELPETVPVDGIQAKYEAGVLTIRVPKTHAAPAPEKTEGDQT